MVISLSFGCAICLLKTNRHRRLFNLMGGNKNFSAKYFLMSVYGYFTDLQKL